jgi:glycosyltransferase involved in cell wall biosynthesis
MKRLIPDVSVIIPVYNRHDIIARAVGSLLRQDFERPYEIIVIDDGSMDGSAGVIDGIDPRVRVVRQSNKGAASARHAGIRHARGEVVAFLDSDDVADSALLASLWKGLHSRENVVLAFGRCADMDGQTYFHERLPATSDGSTVMDPLVALLRIGCFTMSMNLMTYRSLALKAMRGREHLIAANDYDFAMRIATNGFFVLVNRITIFCDRRLDGISARHKAFQVGYAVLAATAAVHYSRRTDREVRAALRQRLELILTSALSQLISIRQIRLAAQVALSGLSHLPLSSGLRRLWWAFSRLGEQGRKESRMNAGSASLIPCEPPRGPLHSSTLCPEAGH